MSQLLNRFSQVLAIKLPRPSLYLLVAVSTLVIALLSLGYGLFDYPYFEEDEGTYTAQAVSLISQGTLSPYTYWYDHAPLGWIMLSGWMLLTGGITAFGLSLDSGRVMMLVLHLATNLLIVIIAKKWKTKTIATFLAILLFNLSPLAIYYHRRILLDNIMTPLLLASLLFSNWKKHRLMPLILGATCLALAVLVKETAIVFVPAYLVAVLTQLHPKQRTVGLIVTTAWFAGLLSLYPIFAGLKGELLPNPNKVTLLGTLSFQVHRTGGFFLDSNSNFSNSFTRWFELDQIYIYLAGASLIGYLILARRKTWYRLLTISLISYLVFLIRGGIVIDFYIVPLLALVTLVMSVALSEIIKQPRGKTLLIVCLFGIIPVYGISYQADHWLVNETKPQRLAIEWISDNLDKDTVLAVNSASLTDLRIRGFSRSDWYLKIERDPAVAEKIGFDWGKIEYTLGSHEQYRQYQINSNSLPSLALSFSEPVRDFTSTHQPIFVDHRNKLSANGDWLRLYQTKSDTNSRLEKAWRKYLTTFVKETGQVLELESGGQKTTSEGQSYSMLRAVWLKDKYNFDLAYTFAKNHLQHRAEDHLFMWLLEQKAPAGWQVADFENATDADLDITLALILAYEQWHEPYYLKEAMQLIDSIWQRNIYQIGDDYYLIGGSWAAYENLIAINPSYFSPATLKLIAQYDPSHPWDKVIDTNYKFLFDSTFTFKQSGNSGPPKLPPEWIGVDKATKQLVAYKELSSDYQLNSFRTYWRVALDYLWFEDNRALDYLQQSAEFFDKLKSQQLDPATQYSRAGQEQDNLRRPATLVSPIAIAKATNNQESLDYWQIRLESYFDTDHWGQSENYYDQNWAWFAQAMIDDILIIPE